MPIFDPDPARLATDKYWKVVRRTLDEVFHRTVGPADDLRNTLRDRPRDEEALFYHAEPLDVAADLAGIDRPPSDPELAQYDQIRADEGWT